jgi:hypothetical protein
MINGDMAAPPKSKPQADKFRDLARELECDDDEALFDERLRKIARSTDPKRAAPKTD